MIGNTFINNMRISINGREIFNSNSLYAYKTYFSHELSYSLGAKSSHLNAAGYYYDSGVSQESGASFNSRKNLFVNSRTAQFISKLDADLFNQPQYLVNHCEVDIEILPNEPKFILIAPLPVDADLFNQPQYLVNHCEVDIEILPNEPNLFLLLLFLSELNLHKLDAKPARYAIRKTMMKPLFISQGRYEFHANLFMDQIPRRITLGLVANSDYVGTQERSPFNFQPFRVREISIIANGRSFPQSPYDFDYGSNRYVRAFHDMNDAIGFSGTPDNNGITYQQYGRTHCIYVFNLTNSGEDNGGTIDLIKNGSTAVNIKFSQAVPEGGVMLIVMGETDALIMLDKNRSITSDTTI
uniref:Major sperm protein n=1 Tax=Meloidogyne incognita TaxID=6306 RepID=A0A914P0S8_MELIC